MAILHEATLKPTKVELLEGWLASRDWFTADSATGLERVAAYRFDDPAGQVGIETLLVRVPGGPLFQVPLTYRSAPLDGAEPWLVGTLEHSVLGTRWVYDAEGDPVYRAELTRVIREGDTEVEQYYETPDGPRLKADDTHVRGSGTVPGVAPRDDAAPAVVRAVDGTAAAPSDAPTLTGTWAGQDEPVLLAYLP